MAKDTRDVLDALKQELDFLEKGGYCRSVRTPWLPTTPFQDSLICLEYPARKHNDDCFLMQFVPAEFQHTDVPCHHIPLNEDGDTISSLIALEDQDKLEQAFKAWLRSTIAWLEAAGEASVPELAAQSSK